MNCRTFILFLCVSVVSSFPANAGGFLADILEELDLAIQKAEAQGLDNMQQTISDLNTAIEKASSSIEALEKSATRTFAGPSQYPPSDYAAYAILAFHSRPSEADQARYKMFCEAYISAIPHSSEVDTPRDQQLVTVWPIEDDIIADQVNRIERNSTCSFAVLHFGFLSSRAAIDDAQESGLNLSARQGPFLIAWAPPSDRGKAGEPILYMDLSSVDSLQEAKRRMAMWVNDIEGDPGLWKDGWAAEKLKHIITSWANQTGEKILILFTG